MANLLEHVEQSNVERKLFRHGARILIAVSGGLDSTVLLHLLHELAQRHGWKLAVGHLNHQLRGRSSNEDECFVERLAARFDLPFLAERAEVRELAKTHKLSLEMAARRARHEFLVRAAKHFRCRAVGLAHHADDQVELFFLRMLRGAGGEGLRGMKWKTTSPADAAIELVRPLLDVPRTELLDHAEAHGIAFRKDASNDSVNFLRNRVRHRLLPLLRREFYSSLDRTVLRVMEIVGEDAAVVQDAASEWLHKKRPPRFGSLPTGIARAVIRQQLIERGIVPDFELVNRLFTHSNRKASAGVDLFAWRDGRGRVHLAEPRLFRFRSDSMAVDLHGKSGETTFGGVHLKWNVAAKPGNAMPRHTPGLETFDADTVGPLLKLRHWQPGDRFQPIGFPKPVKLQDLWTNARVPAARRRDLIVAEAADGCIFWVEGLRIGQHCRLTAATNRRLQWRWQRR